MTIVLNPVARSGQAALSHRMRRIASVRFTSARKLGYNGIAELLQIFAREHV
jgi:hypothetical protein